MSSPSASECSARWSASRSRRSACSVCFSMLGTVLPVSFIFGACAFGELLAQVVRTLGAALMRALLGWEVGVLGPLLLRSLALELIELQLLGLRIRHADERTQKRRPCGAPLSRAKRT